MTDASDGEVAYPEELALARQALAGDPAAVAILDRLLIESARPRLGKLGLTDSDIDEALQLAREHLLVGHGEGGPALTRYSGRGRLGAFVAVVAGNRALDRLRADAAQPGDWGRTLELADAERRLLRDETQEALAVAVRDAVAALTPRERALLRFAFFDQLGHAEIGAIYGAHRQTVARWIERAVEQLKALASQRLVVLLGAEAAGAGDLLDSTIDLQLSALLR